MLLAGCSQTVELDPGWDASHDAGTDSDIDGDGEADVETDIDADAEADADAEGASLQSCRGFTPSIVSLQVAAALTFVGSELAPELRAQALPEEGGAPIDLGPLVEAREDTIAVVTIVAGSLPAGRHHLTLVGSDGSEVRCDGDLLVLDLAPPRVEVVSPSSAWVGRRDDGVLSDRLVSLEGRGFLPTPEVIFEAAGDPTQRFDAPSVGFFGGERLNAICPSGSLSMPPGEYFVSVQNPEGLEGRWEVSPGIPGRFLVVEVPPPRIDAIDPVRTPASSEAELTVYGAYFQEGATVALELYDGSLLELVTENAVDRPDLELAAAIRAEDLSSELGPHPVWVINPDEGRGVFFSLDATTSAEGHLSSFDQLEIELVAPRERLAATSGFDHSGTLFFFAAGGVDRDRGVRADIEMARVSVEGDITPPRLLEQSLGPATPRGSNLMTLPRNGHALIRVGRWIYAIGGSDRNTSQDLSEAPSLASVERAFILGPDETPRPRPPEVVAGSGLPMGSWRYRVSALGPWGEGLASPSTQVSHEGGQVTFCWDEVAGASAYNVYRNFDASGLGGSERLMEHEVIDTCLVDDGLGLGQPAPSRLVARALDASGRLEQGFWIYRISAMVDGRETLAGNPAMVRLVATEGSAVTLSWNEIPGASYRLYRTASSADRGWTDRPTYLLLDGLAATTYVDDGSTSVDLDRPAPEEITPLPPGSLSLWELLGASSDLVIPREGLGALALTLPSGDDDVASVTSLYAVGGRPDGSGLGYLTSIERAEVFAEGGLGPWQILASEMVQPRAFFALLTNAAEWVEMEGTAPLYLLACQGDDAFEGDRNEGTTSLELTSVLSDSGELEEWFMQDVETPPSQANHGHDGVLYDGYLILFPGVRRERLGEPPDPSASTATRFVFDGDASPSEILSDRQSASASMRVPRAYYDLLRLGSFLYVIGGNDGSGAVGVIERSHQ
jgi:hypothetical protein